jgi:ribonuclease-3
MVLPISQLEELLGYEFRNKEILLESITHRSYSAENDIKYDNQRLEFLGDSVLEIVLTEYLFNRYPAAAEGHLTKMRSALVQQDALAYLARKIGLNDYLMMGKGEFDSNGHHRDSTLSDAFESLIGAFYLDAGTLEAVRKFIIPLIEKNYPEPAEKLIDLNPKGALQEYTQKQWNSSPCYNTIEVSGPDHEPSYKVSVSVRGKVIGHGEAVKRKLAESAAARNALIYLNQKVESP